MNARVRLFGVLLTVSLLASLSVAAAPARPAANVDGDPGATIEIAEDGLSFSFSIYGEALAYWAWGYTCSGEEFGGHLGEWVSEGNIVAPSQIAYAQVGYTFPGWEEGDPYWFVDAYGECPSEPVFDYWGWDAGCDWPFVGAGVYLEYEEPAVGVEVTFTMEGEDPVVTETNEWGQAFAEFPFELGSDLVTIGIDAGEWGEGEVQVGGPPLELCEGNSVTVQVSWPCGQEAPAGTFSWSGTFDAMSANIWTEGDERGDWGEVSSITFEGLIPGATYYYSTGWWIWDNGWGSTEGEFTVPEECAEPEAAPEPVVRNLWAYVNPAAEVGASNICYLLSLTQPTQSEESNDVQRLCFTEAAPDWWQGAILLTHGDVFENGTDWGFWEGDAATNAFSPNARRLPLHAEGPNNDLVDKAEMFPWTQ